MAVILIFVACNLRTLASLGRELRLLERQQIHRLKTATQVAKSVPAPTVVTNSAPASPAN